MFLANQRICLTLSTACFRALSGNFIIPPNPINRSRTVLVKTIPSPATQLVSAPIRSLCADHRQPSLYPPSSQGYEAAPHQRVLSSQTASSRRAPVTSAGWSMMTQLLSEVFFDPFGCVRSRNGHQLEHPIPEHEPRPDQDRPDHHRLYHLLLVVRQLVRRQELLRRRAPRDPARKYHLLRPQLPQRHQLPRRARLFGHLLHHIPRLLRTHHRYVIQYNVQRGFLITSCVLIIIQFLLFLWDVKILQGEASN
ncbi:hypothetical protein L596_014116 [Steinernema carpocapsae]|uniref:Uncharacterized protein n=1 Tax=Steinernema carpocapsae TaxID=34508 RepID=A0A4U5NAR8_STECR|nr:hypothetical protein L596_014116 [Steinernema carpocapsae]